MISQLFLGLENLSFVGEITGFVERLFMRFLQIVHKVFAL
jgi:hypothetical protein